MKTALEKVVEVLMWVVSFTIAIGLFILLPTWLGVLGGNLMFDATEKANMEIARNIIEGIMRLVIFVAYIKIVSFIPEIKRVFRYHGAEHMTVNAYECGSNLSIEEVEKFPTFHPRCGTSFIFFLIIVHIVLFTILHIYFPFLDSAKYIRYGSRLLLLPFIAGIAYECIRYTGKHLDSIAAKLIMYPGKIFQGLTALQPDRSMLEVAIYAFKGAMGDPTIEASSVSVGADHPDEDEPDA